MLMFKNKSQDQASSRPRILKINTDLKHFEGAKIVVEINDCRENYCERGIKEKEKTSSKFLKLLIYTNCISSKNDFE